MLTTANGDSFFFFFFFVQQMLEFSGLNWALNPPGMSRAAGPDFSMGSVCAIFTCLLECNVWEPNQFSRHFHNLITGVCGTVEIH